MAAELNGVSGNIIDVDEYFATLISKPIILTDLPYETISDRRAVDELVQTVQGKEVTSLDAPPSCSCGNLNKSEYLHDICEFCGTRCEYDHTRTMEPSVWISAPDCILGLINPQIYGMLSASLQVKNWNGLDYLLNTRAPSPDRTNIRGGQFVKAFQNAGLRRGLNEFIEDLDKFIPMFIDLMASKRKKLGNDWATFFDIYRDVLICRHLPIPTKIAFVIEQTALGEWTDPPFKDARNAIVTAVKLNEAGDNPREIGNRLAVTMHHLELYYEKALGDPLMRKAGLYRKAVFGTRTNFTFRTVISSITEEHHYEDLHIPYQQAVVIFKPHLLNILVKRHNFTMHKAFKYIEAHTAKWDDFLHEQLMTIVRESYTDGYPCTGTRYPTLARASTQLFKIKGFTKEFCSRISVMCLTGPNADFDGDSYTFMLINSKEDYESYQYLRPHFSIHNVTNPRTFNNNMRLPDAIVSTLSNAIEIEDMYLKDIGVKLE